jgi:N-acyl-D-aspartate/D-glutamate deacylase
VPSRLANEDELIRLASVCRDFDGTSLEFLPRTSGNTPFEPDEVELLTAMSRSAQRPLNWNLLRVEADNDVVDERLSLGTYSLDNGGRVVALCLPEPLELYMSFYSGAVLDTFFGWEPTMRLPAPERRAALADPDVRRRLEADAASDKRRAKWTAWATHVIVETFAPENRQYEGMSVGDVARRQGKRPFEALLDVVVADDLRTTYRNGTDNEPRAIWEARANVCRDRRVIIGGSDAGAHLDAITTHDYSTRALANLVRRHQVMELEEAVHLITGAPAALYGLHDRGLLRVGKAADVIIFDEDTIDATPVTTKFDLPAGAGRLAAEAIGIDQVIVNGEVVAERGEFTDARPGRLLRSGIDTHSPALR